MQSAHPRRRGYGTARFSSKTGGSNGRARLTMQACECAIQRPNTDRASLMAAKAATWNVEVTNLNSAMISTYARIGRPGPELPVNRLHDLRACSSALSNVDDLQTIDMDVDRALAPRSYSCARRRLRSRREQRWATRRECGCVRPPLVSFCGAHIQRFRGPRRRAPLRVPGGHR